MRHLGLAAGILLVPFSVFAQAPASAPPRDRTTLEIPTGTAQLRGRVVASDTGEPLRRAQVRLTLTAVRSMRLSNTDAEGRYEFANLPAGTYTVNVMKAGYVALQFGQRRPFESGSILELSDGEVVDQIDFALPRGSVIVGRITDEAGDPITGATVEAMRYVYMPGGRRRLASVAPQNWLSNLTNDLGEFRLFGLMPGSYIISATAQSADIIPLSESTGNAESFNRPTGYVQTFFPGTSNVAEADTIVVNLSEEAQASFPLARARLAEVSGILRRSDGAPAGGTRIILRPDEAAVGSMSSSWSNLRAAADGRFRFGHIPPGRFILEAIAESRAPTEFARMTLTISGRDMSGVVLSSQRGISISGHVIFPTGSVPKNASAARPRITAVSPNPFEMTVRGQASSTIDEQGRFHIQNVSGPLVFRANDLPSNLVLKSVTLNGADITDSPYDSAGGDVTGLAITFVEQAQISGTIRNARGEQVRDYRIVLFPASRMPEVRAMRFVRTATSDQNGRFQIGGLIAGEYMGVAVASFENGQEWDPAFRRSAVRSAKRFAITAGQTLTIELPYAD